MQTTIRHLTESPRAHGFAIPAEWTPHAATWMAWPSDDDLWEGLLEEVRVETAEFVRTLSGFEPVHMLVHDEEAFGDARARVDGCDVTLHRVPLDDFWMRDNGPIFVVNAAGDVSMVNFEFNAWGGKFACERDNKVPEALAKWLGADHFDSPIVMEGGSLEVDGRGTALTTRQCLLSEMRNAHLTEDELAAVLRDWLGLERVLWLEEGLEGDHTDGHIDTIARFTDERTIVCCVAEDKADNNFEPMHRNHQALLAARDPYGLPYRVVELPLPREHYASDSEPRLAASYANFYVANGVVIVPQYGDVNDSRALDVLRPLYPGRKVAGCMARNIITGGGAFHCMTQQQPAGRVWRQV